MNMIRYGTVTVETIYVDHELKTTLNHYKESVKIDDHKDALAEYLKLLDLYQEGEITDFGIQCHTNKEGKLTRADKIWSVQDLS